MSRAYYKIRVVMLYNRGFFGMSDCIGEVGQKWPYTILQIAFSKTHESASPDKKVPFMIFGVFILNLCGKLASQFSNLSLQCQDFKAFPLEKLKQRFSGNFWISVSGVKRRPQNIVSLIIKLEDAVIHLGYFHLAASPVLRQNGKGRYWNTHCYQPVRTCTPDK